MLKTSTKKIETIKFPVNVTRVDIEEGECLLANKCMVRVAVERKLREIDPSMPNHHTRVDAGHIKFNYRGHRYAADTARVAKANLIEFDDEVRERRKAKKSLTAFKSKVEPFGFKVVAIKGAKLQPTTRKRKDNINIARKERQAAGQKPKKYTLHKRVVGFA